MPTVPASSSWLGSTGSIGVNTLDVAAHLNRSGAMKLEVVGLAACSNVQTLIEQAQRFNVQHLAIADRSKAETLRQRAAARHGV